MTILPPEPRIASAFFVLCGQYGEVTRYAQQRDVFRQCIYREAAQLRHDLTTVQQQNHELHDQLQQAALEARLAQAVILDAQKQAEVACVGQARGLSLRDCHAVLDVLLPGHTLSVAELADTRKPPASRRRPCWPCSMSWHGSASAKSRRTRSM